MGTMSELVLFTGKNWAPATCLVTQIWTEYPHVVTNTSHSSDSEDELRYAFLSITIS
jgi:hypothetical protein